MDCFKIKILPSFIYLCLLFPMWANSADKQAKNKVETLSEVSIIGSSELPNVNFDTAWKLPTIQKRGEQSPPMVVNGVLEAIEPKRQRQQLHFSRFLEVDSSSFNVR